LGSAVLTSLWIQQKKEEDLFKKVPAVLVKEKSVVSKCLPRKSEVLMMIQTCLMRKPICMTTRNQKINPRLRTNEVRKARVTQMLKAVQHRRSFDKKNISLKNPLKSPKKKKPDKKQKSGSRSNEELNSKKHAAHDKRRRKKRKNKNFPTHLWTKFLKRGSLAKTPLTSL